MALTLALTDAAVMFVAVCAIVLGSEGASSSSPAVRVAVAHALALVLCALTAFYYYDLYDLRRVPNIAQMTQRLPRAAAMGAVLAVAVHAPFARSAIASGRLLASGLAAVGLVLAVRAVAYHLIQKPPRVQRVLIIGGGPMAQELITEIQARPELRFKIVGVVEDDPASVPAGCARLGSLKDLARVATDVHPDRVIVALASRRGRMPYKTLLDLRLRGILVEDGVEVGERMTGKVAIEALTPSSLIFAREFKPFHLDLALARVASVPTAAAGLILLSPLFALIALAIRLDSAGPLFFVQERVGLQGRLFRLIKFRTMHPTRGATSEWVKDNQGRLTRVGRWLRRFRLDELPQLVNILRGDMNLVGPRPHPLSNLPLFVMVMRNTPECGEQIPYYALRSMVRPGLTGWAQVRYHYANDLEEEIEKMRYDLYYTKHRSAWLDLRILLETVKIVLRGRESALKAAAEERPHGPETGPRPRPAAGNGAAAARRAGAA